VSLAPGGGLAVSPGSRLTPDLRELVKANKSALVNWLQAANDPTSSVSAMAAAANDPTEPLDPDRWCWPYSEAMTGREIEVFTERATAFNRRGMPSVEAEALAYKLVNRDRDGDDRRLCLECANLSRAGGAMRCSEWQLAGMGAAGIPAGLVMQLQRCDGFRPTR